MLGAVRPVALNPPFQDLDPSSQLQTSLPRGFTLATLVNHISWNSPAAWMPAPLFSYLLEHVQRLQRLHRGSWNLNSSPTHQECQQSPRRGSFVWQMRSIRSLWSPPEVRTYELTGTGLSVPDRRSISGPWKAAKSSSFSTAFRVSKRSCDRPRRVRPRFLPAMFPIATRIPRHRPRLTVEGHSHTGIHAADAHLPSHRRSVG